MWITAVLLGCTAEQWDEQPFSDVPAFEHLDGPEVVWVLVGRSTPRPYHGIFRVEGDAITAQLPLPLEAGRPQGLYDDGHHLWLASADGVFALDRTTGEVVESFPIEASAITHDGEAFWVLDLEGRPHRHPVLGEPDATVAASADATDLAWADGSLHVLRPAPLTSAIDVLGPDGSWRAHAQAATSGPNANALAAWQERLLVVSDLSYVQPADTVRALTHVDVWAGRTHGITILPIEGDVVGLAVPPDLR